MSLPESEDPLLAELDDIRRRIFEECGNDPQRYIAFYREYQKQFADRLITRHDRQPRDKSAA
jgi:hypothetical protein